MGKGGFRRSRLVTVPLIILAFGLLGVLARERADRPEELTGLPGTGHDAPRHGAATTSTSAVTSTTFAPEAGAGVTIDAVDRSVLRTTVSRRPPARSNSGSTAVPPTAGGGPTTVVPRTSPGVGPADPSPTANAPALPSWHSTDTTSPAAGPSGVTGSPTTTPSPATTTSTTSPSVSTTSTTVPPDATFEHTYPAEHEGPVWIRVQAPDGDRRTIRIRWGPHQRLIVHETPWAVTYAFRKGAGPTVPTTVTVSSGSGVSVVFGKGLIAPIGSVDVNDGWTTEPEPAP